MKLDAKVLASIDECVLCWLATSSIQGQPSVSPKEIFSSFDDNSIIIANIASPKSARNIRENPYACISFVDVFTQRGFQVQGAARYLCQGDDCFAEVEGVLLELTGGLFPFKSAFQVLVEEVNEIVAPRYRLFPGTTKEEQIASAMKAYGVQPLR